MDLFSLLQIAFAIFASLASMTLIASFIAYKIKQYRAKGNEKMRTHKTVVAHSISKGDVVHTVALPEAGTINIVPKPIMMKRRSSKITSQPVVARTSSNRFTVVNDSLDAFHGSNSFNPVNSLSRGKFTIS